MVGMTGLYCMYYNVLTTYMLNDDYRKKGAVWTLRDSIHQWSRPSCIVSAASAWFYTSSWWGLAHFYLILLSSGFKAFITSYISLGSLDKQNWKNKSVIFPFLSLYMCVYVCMCMNVLYMYVCIHVLCMDVWMYACRCVSIYLSIYSPSLFSLLRCI